MTFHQSPDFQDAIRAAADRFNLRAVFIEKDYWVTVVLHNLACSDYRNQVVFKGGTSLSKAYACIERFSEDVDLAIVRTEGQSDNAVNKLMKSVETTLSAGLTYEPGHPAENKRGRNRTTLYTYPKALPNEQFGPVKSLIQLEINAFTNPVPHKQLPIQAMVAQFLAERGEENLMTDYGLDPFMVQVLSLERTFAEKLLSLIRLSYSGPEKLRGKIRHFYDLHQLAAHPEIANALTDGLLLRTLTLSLADDQQNSTFSGEWLNQPLAGSPLFANPVEQWAAITPTYRQELPQLVWSGQIPPANAIAQLLERLRDLLVQFDQGEQERGQF